MSIRTLNGISSQNVININNLTGGDGISITDSNINVDVSKQTAKTSISDTDIFLLEEADGTIHKISGSDMKSELEQSTVVAPLLLTGNSISIKGLSGFTANKFLKVNAAGDSIEYADDNNTEYTAGANLLLSGNEFSLNSTITGNIVFNGTPTINNFIEVKGQSGQIGYINFYDTGTTNNISLIPPTTIIGSSYNVILPSSAGTLALTSGDITGNADTATKISSITNNNIVQLTEQQTLTNKTFNDLTIFNNGVRVKSTETTNSGFISFFEANDNGTNNIDLHCPLLTTHDYNAFLPKITDISIEDVYVLSNRNVLGGTNVNIGNSTTDTIIVNLDTTLVGNLTWTGSQTYQNTLEITGPASSLGYINLYSNDDNKISLKTNVNIGSSYDVILPSATGTLLTNQDVIPVNKGGTNLTSYAVGDILYASGTTALTKLAKGSANTFLMSNGTIPFYSAGYSFQNPISASGMNVSMGSLSGFGTNDQIVCTNGSDALQYRTLTAGTNISIGATSSTITINSTENYWERNSNISSFDLQTNSTVDSIALGVPFVSSSSINIAGGLITGSGDYLKWVNYNTNYRALELYCVMPPSPAAQKTTHLLLKNGETDFASIQQNKLGFLFINYETSGVRFEIGSNWTFGHAHAKFYYDGSAYTWLYDPSGTNGAASFAGAYLGFHNNGSAIYLNTPGAGTSAGDYIGFATGNVPKGRMEMTGNFKITGSVTESHSFSDERVKENIKDYDTNATQLLNKLKIKSFNRKTFDNLNVDDNGILLPFAERF
ncbi:tail fiber domain-containing protein, partial [bacterium]|nr:tail fiber domain-containing protein [bacterium]